MRRKKLIGAGIAIILLLAVIVAFLFFSPAQSNVRVIGSFSATNAAEIQSTLRNFRRREILPDLSWRSLRNVPAGVKNYFRPIESIQEVPEASAALVMLSPPNGGNAATNGIQFVFDNRTGTALLANTRSSAVDVYLVRKTPQGWVVTAGARTAPNSVKLIPSPPVK